jgi:hypothetical protein
MSEVPDEELVPGLSGGVVGRRRSDLGERAENVLRCLRTAVALVARLSTMPVGFGLRRVAYNLREALNHVVEEQDAAEGVLSAVLDA